MKRLTFYIDKKIIDVFVQYKKTKNIYLKIKKKQIYCSAPFGVSDDVINVFIKKHIKKFSQIIDTIETNEKFSLVYDFLYISGKKFFFQRLAGFHDSQIEIYNNKIYIKTIDSSDGIVKSTIRSFLISELEDYLSKNLAKWSQKMKLEEHTFSVMNRKTAWGLNVTNKNHVKFSYYLMYFDISIIDYVIVHELAHTIEPNHSSNFWDIVKYYITNYKDVQLELKNNFDLNDI